MIKKLFYLFIFSIIVASVFGYILIDKYSQDLPNPHQLEKYAPAITTRLYSANGSLLEEYAKEHRIFIPISSIPKSVINAFLAAEDKNFYSHLGIDVQSIFRAILTNLMNYHKKGNLVGGSTITQQVVKNFFLSNEKTFDRKIKEAILSYKISKNLPKDKILELYLNEIYLGASSYGIASAALNYFNKSIDDLTIEEAALLASLPKAPSAFDPRKNRERALKRRNWVIGRMQEDGHISHLEASKAIAKPISLNKRKQDHLINSYSFTEEVRREVAKKYGSDVLYEGGLVVRTTIDNEIQQMARESMLAGLQSYERRHGYRGAIATFFELENWQSKAKALFDKMGIAISKLEPYELAIVTKADRDNAYISLYQNSKKEGNKIPLSGMSWTVSKAKRKNLKVSDVLKRGELILVKKKMNQDYELMQMPKVSGGMIVMEPQTGRVLAMVGGFFENLEFNRVTQGKRQPGSIIKPFVYLSALEDGLTPATIINDEEIELYQGPGLPIWKPQNHSKDFLGPLPLRKGLEKSRNTMTVNVALKTGMEKINKIIREFGINENPPPFYSSVLGSIETTLIDITNAYGILINGGKETKPGLIEFIQDRNGKTIYRRDESVCETCHVSSIINDIDLLPPEIADQRKQLIDPRSAYQMVSLLEGTVQNGTARRAKAVGKTIGGKTSTTNNSRDGWFVGFSPNLLVGVYVGFDQPKTLGKHEWGSTTALPIFIDFMKKALKNHADTPFPIPAGIKLEKIDAITGQPPTLHTKKHNIIYEAFKVGTEPSANSEENIDVESNDSSNIQQDAAPEQGNIKSIDVQINDDHAGEGTGGLY